MMNIGKYCIKSLGILIGLIGCFCLPGCGDSLVGDNTLSIDVGGFELNYRGEINLKKVRLKSDDSDEIIDLYQEVGDELVYRDSLLIAKRRVQGRGPNEFAQENLKTLENQGLVLSNIKKTHILLKKNEEKINAVLMEYEITEGLINDIPLLYVSQLFVPRDENMILMSFITESQSSRTSASNMFKNIR